MYQKFTLASLFCLLCVVVSAQFEKGQKVLGGSLNFSLNKNQQPSGLQKTEYSTISVSPSLGWFVRPDRIFGVTVNFVNSYEKQVASGGNDTRKITQSGFGAGVFSQQFIGLSKSLYVTVRISGDAVYLTGKDRFTGSNPSAETKRNGFGINAGLAPGLSYRLSSRWLLDATLNNLVSANYSRLTSKTAVQPSGEKLVQENLNISSSLSGNTLGNIGIGFRYLLKK